MKNARLLGARVPWRRRPVSRGQAVVELAIILPVLTLLMMLALDFGRVFFGWVALNNSVRIAANAAAAHPDAWNGGADAATYQALYRQGVVNDLNAINCVPPGHSGAWVTGDIPTPTFKNVSPGDTSSPYELGDHTVVTLSCRFTFLTPLVGNILGNPLTIDATSEFALRGGKITGVPVTTGGCSGATVPNLVGTSVQTARSLWFGAGFIAGTFNPPSGSDTDSVTAQVTSPGSAPGDCLPINSTVTVTHVAGGGTCSMPQLVGSKVSAAQSAYGTAGFTGSFTITRPPNSDYKVTSQDKVAGQAYPCSTPVTVAGPGS